MLLAGRREDVLGVVEQLAGAPLPASAVESLILPARLPGYTPALLDELTAGTCAVLGVSGPAAKAVEVDAAVLGYTEPDPNEDLSGADVARKLLILARTAGVGGTQWVSDLTVHNYRPYPMEVGIQFFPAAQGNDFDPGLWIGANSGHVDPAPQQL